MAAVIIMAARIIAPQTIKKKEKRVMFSAHFHWQYEFGGSEFCYLSKYSFSISRYNCLKVFHKRGLGNNSVIHRCILVVLSF